MNVVMAFGQALRMAFTMLWDIFWGLSLRRGWLSVDFTQPAMYRILPPVPKALHNAYGCHPTFS
jgi:hypothetical protein